MTSDRPHSGDLRIRLVSHWAAVWLVGCDGDHPQFTSDTYQSALAEAMRIAANRGVDVWLDKDDATVERVLSYRGRHE